MPTLPFPPLPAATDHDRRVVAVYLASRAPGDSATTAAGLERATPHDFRRTAVTEWIDTAGLRAAQLLAGHASPGMTAKYDRAGQRRMADAVKRRPLPAKEEHHDDNRDAGNGAADCRGDGDAAG